VRGSLGSFDIAKNCGRYILYATEEVLMSDSPPASRDRLFNPADLLVRLCALGIVAFLLLGAILAALANWHSQPPVPNREIFKMMGASMAFSIDAVGLFLLFAIFARRRHVARHLAEFQKGNFLFHWIYSAQEWEAFTSAEEARLRKSGSSSFWGFVTAGVIVAIIMAFCFHGHARFWAAGISFLGLFAVGIIALQAMRMLAGYRAAIMRACSPQTFISSDAVYCTGDFQFWHTRYRRLIRVISENGMIWLTVQWSLGKAGTLIQMENIAAGRAYTSSQTKMIMRIPIPLEMEEGQEALAMLQTQTQAQENIILG
jgi:hypothetical protein